MGQKLRQTRPQFKILCAWCGHLIARGDGKDSQGTCPKCYAQMLSEYNRTYARGGKLFKASER